MGPRSIDRGITTAEAAAVTAAKLQWGRDQLIAELEAALSARYGMLRFNGAAIN